MGIRIHKNVGWGFDNFTESANFEDKLETLWKMSVLDFYNWCQEKQNEINYYKLQQNLPERKIKIDWALFDMHINEGKKRYKKYNTANQMISFDSEFGLKHNILFSPLEILNTCKRYDDLIDWLEESDHYEPHWKWLNKGIYPYLKGEIPLSIIGVCIFLGIDTNYNILDLKEALYTWWS